MTADQLRLLAELHPAQVCGLAIAVDDEIDSLRSGCYSGTPRHDLLRAAGLTVAAYRWGIAVTTHGDYFRERGVRAPEHAVTLTWTQIRRWAAATPESLCAAARRAWATRDRLEWCRVADLLTSPAHTDSEELTLW